MSEFAPLICLSLRTRPMPDKEYVASTTMTRWKSPGHTFIMLYKAHASARHTVWLPGTFEHIRADFRTQCFWCGWRSTAGSPAPTHRGDVFPSLPPTPSTPTRPVMHMISTKGPSMAHPQSDLLTFMGLRAARDLAVTHPSHMAALVPTCSTAFSARC